MPTDPHSQVCMVSQHHRLTSYFSPFFPGATRAPGVSRGGSSGWGHPAQPQALLLAQAFAKRQKQESRSKGHK